MITLHKRCAFLWLMILLAGVTSACKKYESIVYRPSNQLVKIIKTRYVPNQQTATYSGKPPVIYHDTAYYYLTSFESVYRYDIQGRLISEQQKNVDYPNDSYSKEYNSYTYLGNKVVKFYSNSGGYDTLTINSQGYAISSAFLRNQTNYTYDQKGFLLEKRMPSQTLSQVIINDNVSKQVRQGNYDTQTTEFSYDLDHASLVDPHALFVEGKGSTNLVTYSNEMVTYYSGIKYVTYINSRSYSYEFDQQNRVSQQTILERSTIEANAPLLYVKRFIYSN